MLGVSEWPISSEVWCDKKINIHKTGLEKIGQDL